MSYLALFLLVLAFELFLFILLFIWSSFVFSFSTAQFHKSNRNLPHAMSNKVLYHFLFCCFRFCSASTTNSGAYEGPKTTTPNANPTVRMIKIYRKGHMVADV
eukprot:370574_1